MRWQKRGVSSICGESVYCVTCGWCRDFLSNAELCYYVGSAFCVGSALSCGFLRCWTVLFWCVVLRRWWIFALPSSFCSEVWFCIALWVLHCWAICSAVWFYVAVWIFALLNSFVQMRGSVSRYGLCIAEQFSAVCFFCVVGRILRYPLPNSFVQLWFYVAAWILCCWTISVLPCGSVSLCGIFDDEQSLFCGVVLSRCAVCADEKVLACSHMGCAVSWQDGFCVKRMPVAISVFFFGFTWRLPPQRKWFSHA